MLGISVLFLLHPGCATQADVMDLEIALEKKEAQLAEVSNRLGVVESYFKERSTTVQRGQADLVLKMDEVVSGLQTTEGKLEETNHRLADAIGRLDDLAFQNRELNGRLDTLDTQVAGLERSLGGARSGSGGDRGASGGGDPRSPDVPVNRPGGDAAKPSDQRIILPGRPTEPDKTTGLSPSEAYGLAYNDYLKGNYDLALLGFQNFLVHYKGTSLTSNAQYWIGESYYGKKEFVKAIEAFDKVVSDYSKSDKVPGAILKAGYAFIELGDKAKARSYLKTVVENYPLTNEAKLARNRLAEIN